MFKTYAIGVIFGLIAAPVLLYFVPAVDQVRERSIIPVQRNGGHTEYFHINLPIDRVLDGRVGQQSPVPQGLRWPQDGFLRGSQTEIFKIRNAENRVIGVASRIVGGGNQPFVEWAVHMPARGTMYVSFPDKSSQASVRIGHLQAGTREFAALGGSVVERYVALNETTNNGLSGRLELESTLVSSPTGNERGGRKTR